MKYLDDLKKNYGIKISLVSEGTWSPKFLIEFNDGTATSITLSRNLIEDIKAFRKEEEYEDIIKNIVELELKSKIKYIRKRKLIKLNEESKRIFG